MHDVVALGVSVTVILLGILLGILFNQKGLDKLDSRIDKLDGKVDRLDVKFNRIDVKVDLLGERIGRVETKVDGIQADLNDFSHELAATTRRSIGWRGRTRNWIAKKENSHAAQVMIKRRDFTAEFAATLPLGLSIVLALQP